MVIVFLLTDLFSDGQLDDDHSRTISNFLVGSVLTHLNLKNNNFTDTGMRELLFGMGTLVFFVDFQRNETSEISTDYFFLFGTTTGSGYLLT